MQGSAPRFDVRDFPRILQKRKWFIVLVGLATTLIGGLYAVSYPKVYRATSVVLVRARPEGVVWLSSPAERPEGPEIALDTQASMVMSGELAHKVSLALREKQSDQRVITDAIEVRESLQAQPRPPDRIEIQATSAIERNAMAFANEAAAQFLVLNTEFRREQDTVARKYLEEQLTRAEEQLNDVHLQLTRFRNQMGVYSDDAGASEIVSALARYRSAAADANTELAALEGLAVALQQGRLARTVERAPEDAGLFRELALVSDRPVLFVLNTDDDEGEAEALTEHSRFVEWAQARGDRVVALAARLECELADLEPEEAVEFRGELGADEEGAVDAFLRAAYEVLGYITFFTGDFRSSESRAWQLPRGWTAKQAAGRIHTDIERGFVRAQVVNIENLIALRSFRAAREKALVATEGKAYIVQDGDVINFMHTA